MSLHPSLRVDSASAQQKTVLSRIERIKNLMKEGLWTEDRKVVGLPKTKIVRVKAKKIKVEKAEGAEGAAKPAEGAAAPAGAKPAAGAPKAAAPAAAKAPDAKAKK